MPQTQLQLTYHDLPDLSETYADSTRWIAFDGHSFRFEFCIVRHDEPKPPSPQTARQMPVCRLVIPPGAALDLLNKLQGVVNALVQQGVITINPPMAPPTP